MIDKLKKHWEILIIFILGLTPLLWYKFPNSLALGHDMGYSIDPIMFFKDRLFLWTDRVGLGYDQTINSAAILIHGLEALMVSLTHSIFLAQKIIFIFWFLAPGLAMYYFISTIHKNKDQWSIRLSASLFYMFNHFLLQAWFIAERTKISLFVALPLLTGLVIEVVERRISAKKGLILIFLVFFFFNGGGGLPLFGGLLLSTILAFLFFGSLRVRKNKRELRRLIFLGIGIILSFILTNFYWILPTFIKTISSYRQVLASVGGISGILAWSFEISKYASVFNVMRLMGIPDWYDNPLHPYSQIFFNNPLLVAVSFLIPVIVFSSLFIIKKQPEYKKHVIFFNILALLGIIFTTGSHPPFGVVYNFFLNLVPGFAIFRSPYYKFAPALWFSYAYLFSFSFYYLSQKFGRLRNLIRALVLPLILLYSFPFFTGQFFNWHHPFSTMTRLPSYVLSFDKWANSNLSANDRILTFPEQNLGWNTAIYKWGYWSTAPIESLLTNKSVITNDRVMTGFEKKLIEGVYNSILSGTDDWRKDVKILGVNYFLLHNDFYSNAPGYQTDDLSIYRNKFQDLVLIKKQSFGKWDLYQVPNSTARISVLKNPLGIFGDQDILKNEYIDVNAIMGIPGAENGFVYSSDRSVLNNNFSRAVIEECLFCNKEAKNLTLSLPKTLFLPGSIFYPLVKFKEDRESKNFFSNINTKVDFLLGTSLKRISEINQLVNLKRDDQVINSTIKDLDSTVSLLSDTMETMDKKNSSSKLLILKTDNFLKEETKILVGIGSNASANVYENLTALDSNIEKIYENNKKYEYLYPSDNEKIYLFNLYKPGNRELLIKNSEGEKLAITGLTIDGKSVSPVENNLGDYSSFGIKNFSSGVHEIKFTLQTLQNLIDKTLKSEQFTISPTSSDCRDFNIDAVFPDRIYTLKFDYATERSASADNGPLLKISQIARGETYDSRTQLKANSVLQTYEAKIPTSPQTHALRISICPSPGFEDSSTIDVSNLSLRLFAIPTAALVAQGSTNSATPVISTQDINQTEYKATIKNATSPYLLVLNNSYDPNWQLTSSGKTMGDHLMVNGFANGWIISDKGDYSLDIRYAPQRYYYIGVGLTALFILFSFSYLIHKRNEN